MFKYLLNLGNGEYLYFGVDNTKYSLIHKAQIRLIPMDAIDGFICYRMLARTTAERLLDSLYYRIIKDDCNLNIDEYSRYLIKKYKLDLSDEEIKPKTYSKGKFITIDATPVCRIMIEDFNRYEDSYNNRFMNRVKDSYQEYLESYEY